MAGYYLIGGFIAGFIVGALIYRNNAKRIEADKEKALKEVDILRRRLFNRSKKS